MCRHRRRLRDDINGEAAPAGPDHMDDIPDLRRRRQGRLTDALTSPASSTSMRWSVKPLPQLCDRPRRGPRGPYEQPSPPEPMVRLAWPTNPLMRCGYRSSSPRSCVLASVQASLRSPWRRTRRLPIVLATELCVLARRSELTRRMSAWGMTRSFPAK